jgi:hypothetical protein
MITPPGSLGLRGRQGCPAVLAPPALGAPAGVRLPFTGGGQEARADDGGRFGFAIPALVLRGLTCPAVTYDGD